MNQLGGFLLSLLWRLFIVLVAAVFVIRWIGGFYGKE